MVVGHDWSDSYGELDANAHDAPTPCGSIKDHWAEAKATWVASVGCVVKRPLETFMFCKVLGGSRRRASSCGWAETGGDRATPGFRDHVLPTVEPDVGKSVMTGPMFKANRLTAGLGQGGLFFLSF